ncbi:MAG: hypothetical protein ACM3ZF_00810 [Mycobacterium leprae]
MFYEETQGDVANQSALADAMLILEGEASGSDPVEVALRVGRTDGDVVLDLGTDAGQAIVVTAAGWEIVEASPVLFWRTNAMLPLPTPVRGGSLNALRALLNIQDADWPLILAWLVAALFADLPHPVLLLLGEHGTAKSSAGRLLSMLIDPSASQLRTAPSDVEGWCVACAAGWVTCLDNVSHLAPWLQDALCRAVTGDGLVRRALYTDSDVSVLAFRRVVALTSVDPGPLAGDLSDRLLRVELHTIKRKRAAGRRRSSPRRGRRCTPLCSGRCSTSLPRCSPSSPRSATTGTRAWPTSPGCCSPSTPSSAPIATAASANSRTQTRRRSPTVTR